MPNRTATINITGPIFAIGESDRGGITLPDV
jgi:hypothetical protein